jgi:hypothetical protein
LPAAGLPVTASSTSTAAPPAKTASAVTGARQRAADFARRTAVAPSS